MAASVEMVATESPRLSEREEEVLVLTANGFTPSATARFLHLPVGTVTAELRRIGVEDRRDALAASLQRGLLQ